MKTTHELLSALKIKKSIPSNFTVDSLCEGNWYTNLPLDLKSSRDVVMLILTQTLYAGWEGDPFNELCEVFQDNFSEDKEFVRQYLHETDFENEFFVRASKTIQMDYELLREYMSLGHPERAIEANLSCVHDDVKSNRELMLHLILEFPNAFCEFTEEFRDDYEIAEIALRQNGLMLKFASERLRSDEALVRIAIENQIRSVLFASKKLREFPDGIFYEEYWKVTNGIF
jgi:hypothetical protein